MVAHTILVVGADRSLIASRKLLLEGDGYKVETATGDHDAMRQLAGQRFDMVVLGPSIPPDGYATLEDRVRHDHPTTFIVKIQQNASHRGDSPDAFVEHGMPADLLNAIARLFDGTPLKIAEVIAPDAERAPSPIGPASSRRYA